LIDIQRLFTRVLAQHTIIDYFEEVFLSWNAGRRRSGLKILAYSIITLK